MQKKIAVLRSFEEADRAEKEYYRGLTPLQRLEILLELNARWPRKDDAEAPEGLARVYRIVKLI
jgi:hypothetical protein